MRNFPHHFQAAVRSKLVSKLSNIACCTVAFATLSAFADGVQSNSVGTKPLAFDSSVQLHSCPLSAYTVQFSLRQASFFDAEAQNR